MGNPCQVELQAAADYYDMCIYLLTKREQQERYHWHRYTPRKSSVATDKLPHIELAHPGSVRFDRGGVNDCYLHSLDDQNVPVRAWIQSQRAVVFSALQSEGFGANARRVGRNLVVGLEVGLVARLRPDTQSYRNRDKRRQQTRPRCINCPFSSVAADCAHVPAQLNLYLLLVSTSGVSSISNSGGGTACGRANPEIEVQCWKKQLRGPFNFGR